jgi:hypothetical protein
MTITSPVQGSFVAGAATEQGFASCQAEHRKEDRYLEACRDQGGVFFTISVETCGTWGKQPLNCFEVLVERLAHRTASFFYQRLSIALQPSIGNALLRRAPASGPDTGY